MARKLRVVHLDECAVDLSEMLDPNAGSLVGDALRGVPLADFECSHGHLPTDPIIRCTCFEDQSFEQEWRDSYYETENIT